MPNDAGKFDEVTVDSDKTYTSGFNDTRMLCYNGTSLDGYPVNQTFSGPSVPSGSQYMMWYDTTNNIIKWTTDGGSTWTDQWSLPVCIVTGGTGVVNSIDQIFNGFGYIGSTVFALPGVKGRIPNGRNADGSLKNIEFTIDSVKTATRTWVDSSGQVWGYVKNPPTGIIETWYWNRYIESDEEPSKNEYTIWYKPNENITYVNNGAQSST